MKKTEISFLGGSNNKGCLVAFPSSKNKLQKVVFGGKNGKVTCMTFKKPSEPTVVFKSQAKGEITALCLGGSKGVKDKAFVAHGNRIRAMKKKGKEFFSFETAQTEDIRWLYVDTPEIFTACDYTFNRIEVSGSNVNDTDVFMSPDRINAMAPLRGLGRTSTAMGLGCQDRYIRIVDGSKAIAQCKISAPVSALSCYGEDPGAPEAKGDRKMLVYGDVDGNVGQIMIRPDNKITPGFSIRSHNKRRAGVTALESVDILQDGVHDVVVAREDGSVEVYSIDEGGEAVLNHEAQIANESVTSIVHGNIVSMNTDVLFSTYSGRLSGLTVSRGEGKSSPYPSAKPASRLTRDAKTGSKVATEEEVELLKEIAQLEKNISEMKEKYLKYSKDAVATRKQFNVKHGMKLDEVDGCYRLLIEIDLPIDMVLLHSDVPLLTMDDEESDAICVQSEPDREEANAVLNVYTCQNRDNRLRIKFRTVEGQFGTLSCYVIPQTNPKSSQRIQIPIKPLSLHSPMDYFDAVKLQEGLPVNTLTITGHFSLAQVHGWVSAVVPGVPRRLSSDTAELGYRSCFIASTLTCQYTKERATFRSESVTAISIIKEVISREATNRQVKINIKLQVKPESVFHMLKVLRPKLDHHFAMNRKSRLLAGLKEIKSHEEDVSYLSQEYRDILENGQRIKDAVANAPKQLEFLKGLVMDLYVDNHKLLHGAMPHPRKQEDLGKALSSYDFDSLLSVFDARRSQADQKVHM